MPSKQRTNRMSLTEVAEACHQVDSMLKKGWIRPSSSPYGALLFFVQKKMGELHMCIDYQLLNKQTRLDQFPIPRIDDLQHKVASATVFSKIDLSNAYQQVPIEEGHQFKTAFQISFGFYEQVILPLRLYNAPETFQGLMHNVVPASQYNFVVVYLDDILIFSRDRTGHFEHVKYVLEQLRAHGLKAKAKKTEFCLDQAEYLEHIMQNGTFWADPSKVDAVAEWPVPSDIKQLQSFLGLVNYYNRFIRQFAHIAAPLISLLFKNVPFAWGQEQQQAFDDLKVLLTATPVLQILNFDYDFVLEIDASAFAIEAALMQDKGDGLQPIAYFTKKLSDSEICYAPHEIELLAIISAFEKFILYVKCCHTTVKTDPKPLIHVKTQPHLSNRQIRWAQKLGRYSYTVEHKKGTTNVAADTLNRRPDLQGKKAKIFHFSDQRGFPLVSARVFEHTDVIMPNFKCTIRIARASIKNSTKYTSSKLVTVLAKQVGLKTSDRNFL